MRCELCKCLNLVAEAKKHPSVTVWSALRMKFSAVVNRSGKTIETFCDTHRQPLTLISDVQSVGSFIGEVQTLIAKAEGRNA